MTAYWIGVASREHVRRGLAGGFCQLSHGKAAPLRRLKPGDRIVYYSPNSRYSPNHASRERDRLQAFTAIGTATAGKPYRAEMVSGFQPYRRDVAWHEACPTPLAMLQDELDFTREKNWGYRLRQGLIEISERDMATIAEAMFTGAAPLYRQAA